MGQCLGPPQGDELSMTPAGDRRVSIDTSTRTGSEFGVSTMEARIRVGSEAHTRI